MLILLRYISFGFLFSVSVTSFANNVSFFSDSSKVLEQFDGLEPLHVPGLNDGCYIRAHVWARQLELEFGTKSGKAFVLFTPLLQDRMNLKWWYHVAPYVQSKDLETGAIVDLIFDKELHDRPINLEDWLKQFSPSGCKEVDSLLAYDQELIFGGCVVIRSTMYNFVPSDLGRDPKTKWSCNDFHKVNNYLVKNDLQADEVRRMWPQYCR
jgi:hypothetical protein